MASNAKYQPAPTSDPDDHVSYTQPPPAYQAEGGSVSGSSVDPTLLGAPRSSEDNIPDDFKVGFA